MILKKGMNLLIFVCAGIATVYQAGNTHIFLTRKRFKDIPAGGEAEKKEVRL